MNKNIDILDAIKEKIDKHGFITLQAGVGKEFGMSDFDFFTFIRKFASKNKNYTISVKLDNDGIPHNIIYKI